MAQPPKHLSPAARAWWSAVMRDYVIDDTGRVLLDAAAETLDRLRAAQRILANEGPVFLDRFGQPRAHPACTIERDCSSSLVRLLKQLALDVEPILAPGRPSGGSRNAYQSN